MDFFTSLLRAYENAEEIGLVDQQKGNNEPVLLPIYHTGTDSPPKHSRKVYRQEGGERDYYLPSQLNLQSQEK